MWHVGEGPPCVWCLLSLLLPSSQQKKIQQVLMCWSLSRKIVQTGGKEKKSKKMAVWRNSCVRVTEISETEKKDEQKVVYLLSRTPTYAIHWRFPSASPPPHLPPNLPDFPSPCPRNSYRTSLTQGVNDTMQCVNITVLQWKTPINVLKTLEMWGWVAELGVPVSVPAWSWAEICPKKWDFELPECLGHGHVPYTPGVRCLGSAPGIL